MQELSGADLKTRLVHVSPMKTRLVHVSPKEIQGEKRC